MGNYPYTQAYQERNRVKGLCVTCGKPRDTNRSTVQCGECRDKRNAYQNARRKLFPRNQRKVPGACKVCGDPRGVGKRSYCDEHDYSHPKAKALRLYHMTSDEYDALGTECKLCGSLVRLQIDHDHLTGRVRGRLCARCNRHLARMEDPGSWSARAIQYLRQTGAY